MKLLEREELVAPKGRNVSAPRVTARRPMAKPDVRVNARIVSRPATRSGNVIAARAFTFAAVLGLTYVSSTLLGYVMLERARQSARHGTERAMYARQQAKTAREAIETLTNPTNLRAWADTHGFISDGSTVVPGGTNVAPRGGGLVARL